MKPRSFLLIRLSSLGDVILTNSVVTELRGRFPDARIDFVVRKESKDLIAHNPAIDRLFVLDVRAKGSMKTLRKELRGIGYDTVVDLQGNFRSSFLRKIPKARIRRIQKNRLLRFFLVKFQWNLFPRFYRELPTVPGRYFAAVAEAGPFPERTDLFLPPEHLDEGRRILEKTPGGLRSVIMAPGARHFTKRWPEESYRELIRKLFEHTGRSTVLVGGPDEIPGIRRIQEGLPEEMVVSVAGEISLLDTLGFIAAGSLFISNDSALMHAAAAFQIPQLAIFGSTVRELGFFPVNPRARILENPAVSCRPCSHIGRSRCPKTHFRCMTTLGVEDALDLLKPFLNDPES